MEGQGASQGDIGWTKEETVCHVFMENLQKWAAETKVEWGMKSEQIVAYGKIGCTCKVFREYLKDPAMTHSKFNHHIAYMIMSWP